MNKTAVAAGLVVSALILASCAPRLTQDDLAAIDIATCEEYGFTPGTDAFAQCRLDLAQARATNAAIRAAGGGGGGFTPVPEEPDTHSCFLDSQQRINAFETICYYKCGLSTVAETVNTGFCPATIQR